MTKATDEKINFHREIMLRELDSIDIGPRLSKEELFTIAKRLYEDYYKDKIPYTEVEKYNPNGNQ
jgi:hypothetical protein